MKNKKYFVVIIVILSLLLVLVACQDKNSTTALIAQFVTDNGISYEILETTTDGNKEVYAKVSSVENPNNSQAVSDITIPSKIIYQENEYSVLSIGSLAFSKAKYSIIRINEGIETIESFAFQRAESNVIYLPSTITYIGEYAFVDCLSLSIIHLEASIPPELGDYAFMAYQKTTKKYTPSPILKIMVREEDISSYQDINKYPNWESYQGNLR
ncbi:MAG: leucine-rich repeat protein [Clostridia bacterium]